MFFYSFGFCLLLIFYPCSTVPAAKLTPLWSLKADCFLIGAVPEVVVVMVTCAGYLEGLAGHRWVKVGGCSCSRKLREALIQGFGVTSENRLSKYIFSCLKSLV